MSRRQVRQCNHKLTTTKAVPKTGMEEQTLGTVEDVMKVPSVRRMPIALLCHFQWVLSSALAVRRISK